MNIVPTGPPRPVVQISGGDEPGGPSNLGPEASLNIQYTEAMAYPTPHIWWNLSKALKALFQFCSRERPFGFGTASQMSHYYTRTVLGLLFRVRECML